MLARKVLICSLLEYLGLAVSQRHTYLFSAGDDKQVKCWDLEQNKVRYSGVIFLFLGGCLLCLICYILLTLS